MSESNLRQVMYIGRKPRKSDNVTGNIGRAWNGLGDVQETTKLEAMQLVKHADVWKDVTDWPEEQRLSIVSAVRSAIRSEARKHQKIVPLHLASKEELMEQLAKLDKPGALMPKEVVASGDVKVNRQQDNTNQETGEEKERPETTKEVVAAIVGAIQLLDPDKPELFDADGEPTKEALIQQLGWIISDSERKAALKALAKV